MARRKSRGSGGKRENYSAGAGAGAGAGVAMITFERGDWTGEKLQYL
jgi:hypothetical protein